MNERRPSGLPRSPGEARPRTVPGRPLGRRLAQEAAVALGFVAFWAIVMAALVIGNHR